VNEQVEAATELTPEARVLDISYTALVTQRALYAAAKLGIADLMGTERKASDELARATGTHPRAMYRLLRALASAGVLSETPEHQFALTPVGATLRTGASPSMRAWVLFSGEPFYLQAWEEIVHSIRTGRPAWNIVHGSSFFEYLREHPDTSAIFDEAMTSLSAGEAPAVAAAYDFSHFETLVDVAGGHGTLLVTILRGNAGLRGILFDQPPVIEGARQRINDEGLTARCELVAGDFFQSLPGGADAYILKYVIHDWEDQQAIKILSNCRQAIRDSGTLLLVETIVPPHDEPHYAKLADLEMLVLLGSLERTSTEYAELLRAAGFALSRVVPTREYMSVIEAVPI
jgi:hypothetical protein